ncbi:MAG TPA: cadmium-translocating P-type ATPase [Candidatus Butyricicoccus avistercoris]|uniref:Cadmium-translocating P-type ATPase n=1 Tax=Candidatus Butyricicoccus avistercoris TaxID=2838518 RepID=A0A9D1PIU6_9FIRM|nr:cadmium-translocating P-type ATPase [Candidatus Butyricicoccus avistercoris]
MTKKQKKMRLRIIISLILYIICLFIPAQNLIKLALFLVPYFIIGYDVLLKAINNIKNGQVFDENFLMTIATIGAFIIGEYNEGVAVMLFYQVGELFQSYAVGKSRESIASLMDIRPDFANIEQDGKIVEVDPDEVEIGQTIIVKAGEKIPIDGIVLEGTSSLDTSALTGESVPRDVFKDSEVISGCINLSGVLKIRTTKEFGESTVSKILDLVENSSVKKAKAENFVTKFARYYTPFVVILAAVLAISLPFIINISFADSFYRALTFLVISCPCALVISIPLSFFGGIGGASKEGILVKGGNYLEALAKLKTVVFDKTGTLTKGIFDVSEVITANGFSESEVIELACLAESYSKHPIATALRNKYNQNIDFSRISDTKELAGMGISAIIDEKSVLIGNERLMQNESIDYTAYNGYGTVIYVSINNKYAGYIVITDEIKPNADKAIKKLYDLGIKKTVMLTGDNKKAASHVADMLNISDMKCELLPADKVSAVEQILNAKDGVLAFVGDGINDAPVLARADVGIAMGGLGSDAAIEAADIVLMDDKLEKLADAVKIARKTVLIVKENIVFALGCKLLVLILGAFGYANMWAAVFADVGVAIIAILNSSRMLMKISRK